MAKVKFTSKQKEFLNTDEWWEFIFRILSEESRENLKEILNNTPTLSKTQAESVRSGREAKDFSKFLKDSEIDFLKSGRWIRVIIASQEALGFDDEQLHDFLKFLNPDLDRDLKFKKEPQDWSLD